MFSHGVRVAAFCVGLSVLQGCGGGGSGSPATGGTVAPPVQPSNASPGGVWEGKDSVSGLDVIGLVAESGEFHFIRADNVQYTGTVTTTGNSISGSFQGFTPIGFVFADGSTYGTGSVYGTIQERAKLTAQTNFTTTAGSNSTGTLPLVYNSLYDRDSSLATIAGNFHDSTGAVVTVNSSGQVFSQNATNGCVINGQISIINASYNAYRAQWTYASCTGQSSILNGLTFNGLATLDNTTNPESAIVGATATSGTTRYSVVLDLVRM